MCQHLAGFIGRESQQRALFRIRSILHLPTEFPFAPPHWAETVSDAKVEKNSKFIIHNSKLFCICTKHLKILKLPKFTILRLQDCHVALLPLGWVCKSGLYDKRISAISVRYSDKYCNFASYYAHNACAARA